MAARKSEIEKFRAQYSRDLEHRTEKLALEFNSALRSLMHEKGVTQTELADRMGVSRAHVSRLLNCNRNLTIKSLVLLAHSLEASWASPQLMPFDANGVLEKQESKVDFKMKSNTTSVSRVEMHQVQKKIEYGKGISDDDPLANAA